MPIEAALRLARALRGGDEEPRKSTPQITALRDPEALAQAMEFRESVMAPTQPKRPIDEQASWYSAAGYTPQDVRGGMKGITSSPSAIAKASEMAMGMGPGATVYHGSPHRFEKFDAAKIGTGEGAQAYGHGLYFAENPAVAMSYRPESTAGIGYKGKTVTTKTLQQIKNQTEFDAVSVIDAARSYDKGLDILKRRAESDPKWGGAVDWAVKNRDRFSQGGNLYHVDLPDEQIARMIDWDKPLSAQPEHVRKALEQYAAELPKRDLSWQMTRTTPPDYAQRLFGPTGSAVRGGEPSGEDIYNRLRTLTGGGAAEASKVGSELGIPGIRYLDQGSRAGGEGTSNYVVFNPEILKILRRE